MDYPLQHRVKIIVYIFPLLLIACFHKGSHIALTQTELDKITSGPYRYIYGAIVKGDTLDKSLALVFTGDEFADGGNHIIQALRKQNVAGSFFLTGNFYRNPEFASLIMDLAEGDFYLGAHSDQHLLYCDWEKRDSLLVSRSLFRSDLENNYRAMAGFGIRQSDAPLFLPPYEWYNDTIAIWSKEMGVTLINMTHGTLSHADYTLPGTEGYRSSKAIYHSILEYEAGSAKGLNGFILLSHIGSSSKRKDKFYLYLDDLITELKARGYAFTRIDSLLTQ